MDILPLGEDPRASDAIRWSTGETMGVRGFHHVFAQCAAVSVDGVAVPVAPPAVVFLLKVYALLENPDRVEKDVGDLTHLLEAYVGDDDSRRFEDDVLGTGMPFETVSAYLLGMDVAMFAEDVDRRAIGDFLARARSEKDHVAGCLVRVAPPRWRQTQGTTAAMLDAFARGLGVG